MKRRVVVTGMGAITPIGNSVEEFWNGIKEEKIGFAQITKFDASEYKCKMAAEVKDLIQSFIWIKKLQEEWNSFQDLQLQVQRWQ